MKRHHAAGLWTVLILVALFLGFRLWFGW